jgi:hypothetical protein
LTTASVWTIASATSASTLTSTFRAVTAGGVGLGFVGAVITAFAGTALCTCATTFTTALTTAAVVPVAAFARSTFAALA